MNLILVPGLLEEVIADAKARYPKEACGLLVGRENAERFIPMRNIRDSGTAYEADPAQLAGALRGLRESGEKLVAIYHSHPHGPARPSMTDVELACYPEAAHLIVGLADLERPRAAAFRIVEGEAVEVGVHVIV